MEQGQSEFWHDTGWWREPVYDGHGGFSPEYREAIIATLAGIFDRKWYRNGDIKHAALFWLHGKGVLPYGYLVDLAQSCHLASRHGLLNKTLIQNLKLHEHFLGAYFEVSVLAQLIRAGIVPKRPPQNGKNADFLIEGEPHIYLEVKHAKPARGNAEARGFELAMLKFIQDEVPIGINYEVALGERILGLLETKEGANVVRANLTEWLNRLRAELQTAISEKAWHKKKEVEGLFSFVLSEGEQGHASGEFTGASNMTNFEIEKICENVIRGAAQQIPPNARGIIIIRIERLLPGIARAIQEFLVAIAAQNVSTVILIERAYGLRVTSECVAIDNPLVQSNLQNQRIVDVLTNWGD